MKSRLPSATTTELAAANAALEACAALLRAQGDEEISEPEPPAPPPPKPPAIDPQLVKEQARLDQLLSAIKEICSNGSASPNSQNESPNSAPKPGGDRASSQILAHAQKVVDGERRAIEAHIEAAKPAPAAVPVAPAKPMRKVAHDRSLRHALDKYFSYFEVPGTQWQLVWQLLTPSGLPSATAYSSTPGGIEAEFGIALPDGEPWRVPAKLSKVEIPADKTITIVSSSGKPMAPSKYYLVGLSWAGSSGSITLSRSKKKLNAPLRIDFSEDGSVGVSPIGPTGEALAPSMGQPGPTNSYLEAVWWKLASAAVDLVHARGSAVNIQFDGAPVERVAEPAKLADVILQGNRELLHKVSTEADAGVCERLAAKFDDVPTRFQDRLTSVGFAAGSNPPEIGDEASDAEETVVVRPNRAPTPAPVAARTPARAQMPEPPMAESRMPEPPMTMEVSEKAIEEANVEKPTTSFEAAVERVAEPSLNSEAKRDPHTEATRKVRPPMPPRGRALTAVPPPAIDAPIDLAAEPAEDERRISERTVFDVAPKRPAVSDEHDDHEEEELTLAAPKAQLSPQVRSKVELPEPRVPRRLARASEPPPLSPMMPIAAVGSAPAKMAVSPIPKMKSAKFAPPPLAHAPRAAQAPQVAKSADRDDTPQPPSPSPLSARELGERLFGPHTISEKFDSLDLEIDWEGDESSDDPNETLPGVAPSVARPSQVTIEN